MKILTCQQPGKFEYSEAPEPTPITGEALIKIKNIGVCGTDIHAFSGNQPFFEYPRVLGHELCGEVLEAPAASGLSPGTRVVAVPYLHCGDCRACRNGKTNCCQKLKVMGVHIDGGMQEYATIPVENLLPVEDISDEAAAVVEPLAIGAHALRRAGDLAGKTVVVVGCGPIGMGIIAQAKTLGAGKVLALDMQPGRLKAAKMHFGADEVIDIREQPEEALAELTAGDLADIVFDATGNKQALETGHRYMGHGGSYVLVGLYKDALQFLHPEIHAKETSLLCSRNATLEDFHTVIEQLREGNFPLDQYITHRLSFEEVGGNFEEVFKPGNEVVKAVISLRSR